MKKALLAASFLLSVFLTGNTVFAISAGGTAYYWSGGSSGVHPGSLVTHKVNIDDYLPWNSGGSAKALGMGGAFTAVANDLGGAVEYNPAGLTYLGHVNIAALATATRETTIKPQGGKANKWTVTPTYAGAALKIGPLAVALSRKQPQAVSTYLELSGVSSGITAPDGFPMVYDTLSDKMDTKDLNTYALTAAIKLGRLSLGANYNSIKGDIARTQAGRIRAQQTGQNNRFDTTEKVNFDGYTMDAGVLMDMGVLRLGAAAKNFKGNVDIKRDITWQDNFLPGAGDTWNWVSPTTKETLTKFAPTYTAGAALLLGKIVTIDMDYVTVNLQDTKKAQGRLGAELAVIPGFLFARGGVMSDFKNLVQNQDQKMRQYFVGAGLKLLVLTVDASASLAQAKAGSSGDNMTGAVSATLKF